MPGQSPALGTDCLQSRLLQMYLELVCKGPFTPFICSAAATGGIQGWILSQELHVYCAECVRSVRNEMSLMQSKLSGSHLLKHADYLFFVEICESTMNHCDF